MGGKFKKKGKRGAWGGVCWGYTGVRDLKKGFGVIRGVRGEVGVQGDLGALKGIWGF